uniref:Carbonic anhydrase n=1 Tax=candidate division WOR-3 bacterium TaxID=2052148 RepID=A0A7C3IVK2_UNCW3
MDGRVQLPVIAWLKADTGADYVDNITEAGPVKILAEGRNRVLLGSIRRRVKISVERHGSSVVAIIAHHDCAGNPVDEKTQRRQLERAIRRVESWGLGVRVIGLWVNEQWQVEG